MAETLWIIDGNNLIRSHAGLARLERESGWEAAARSLENGVALLRSRLGRGHAFVLVYDGVAQPGHQSANRKGIRVLRPASGQEADLIVLREARREEGKREVRVVTSDRRDIGNKLRGLRVRWETSEEFGRRLPGWNDPGAAGTASEKPKEPTGDEVDFWLRAFGEEGKE